VVSLTFAIAFGILIAIAVIAWWPEIVEAFGGCLVVIIGLALLSLMVWAVSPLFEGLVSLVGALGLIGPRVLFVVLAVVWSWMFGRALLGMARYIRHPSGDLPFATSGCLLTIVGFMFVFPLGLAEGARDPLLTILGKPFAIRVLLLSPLLIGLAVFLVGVIVEVAVRLVELVRHTSGKGESEVDGGRAMRRQGGTADGR
jgi:hypothetical protein